MKNTHQCPKCGSTDIIRVPDNAHRYLANSICIEKTVWVDRVSVTRYVCYRCGYLEDWVDSTEGLAKLKRAFG